MIHLLSQTMSHNNIQPPTTAPYKKRYVFCIVVLCSLIGTCYFYDYQQITRLSSQSLTNKKIPLTISSNYNDTKKLIHFLNNTTTKELPNFNSSTTPPKDLSQSLNNKKPLTIISNHNDTKKLIHFPTNNNITKSINSSIIIPTISNKWSNYHLGDGVIYGKVYLGRGYHGSILHEYGRSGRGYNISEFCQIVHKRGANNSSAELPEKNLLVVHLRIGDSLQSIRLDEIYDVWNYGVSIIALQIRNMVHKNQLGWWHYLQSKCYYSAVLKMIPASVKKVVLVGSTVHSKTPLSSQYIAQNAAYLELVKQFFEEEAGYVVNLRINNPPDDDMVYMSHASVFLSAGGGFSKLANNCVERIHNGTTFPVSKGWNSGLNEACGKASRPNIQMQNYSWESLRWCGRGGCWDGNRTFPSVSCHSGWEKTCEVF